MGEAEELMVREEQLVIDWEAEVGVQEVLKREEAFVKLLAAAVGAEEEQTILENFRRRFWQLALLLMQRQPELHLGAGVLSQKEEEGAQAQVVSEQTLKAEVVPEVM
jgi:hypothetical protein